MNILSPLWLLLGLLSLPILLLYMLKLRRREVPVSSIILWQEALRDRQANTPWQRLKRNVLLFLQLMILAGLGFALSRPAMLTRSLASGSLVVLLDASASMASTDVSPTRFEAARQATHRLIREMDTQAHMTLILATKHPVVLASGENDKTRLQEALDAAEQSSGTADWKAAFALAAGAVSFNAGKESPTILIISDGGLPSHGLPALPGEVRFIPIGRSAENLAISAFAIRNSASRSELFASIHNYSPEIRQAVISLYRDGELFSAQQISLPAKGHTSVSIRDLPASQSIYQARLSPLETDQESLDDLPLDDAAFAISQPFSQGKALVITEGNFFLEQVLAALPAITAYRSISTQSPLTEENVFPLPAETFDLYVLDGNLPTDPKTGLPTLPEGNLLLINPPATVLFNPTGSFTNTANTRVSDHPLMQYVDWSGVHIAKARYIKPPEWAEILVSVDGNPLVFAGETGGRRVAVLTFDLHDSDLPLQIAFPVLISNLVTYLIPTQSVQASDSILPGEPVEILPDPGVEQIVIASPTSQIFTMKAQENNLLFNETDELGVYAVNFLKEDSQFAEFFAVNLFDEGESNISPADSIQVGQIAVSAVQEEKVAQRELWPWLAALALIFTLVEWWVYHRQNMARIFQSWRVLFLRTR